MAYFGTLKKVYDNQTKKEPPKPYWGVVIDTEQRGEVTFNLWDGTFAGRKSAKGEDPSCDVHDFINKRVLFEAEPGNEKPDGSGRYPSTIKLIQLDESATPTGASKPPIGTLLADDGRDAKVEAAQGIAQHLEAAQRHLGAALELARGM